MHLIGKEERKMWKKAERQHDAAIVSMCVELNTEDPGTHPVPPSYVTQTLQTLRSEPLRGSAFVLECNGQIAGYAFLITFWSNEMGGEVLYVDEIYVRSEHRGKGYCTSLINDLCGPSKIWPRKWAAVALEVSPSNSKARALYEKLGFRVARNHHMRLRFNV